MPRKIVDISVPLEWCLQAGVKLDFRKFPDGYVASAAGVEAELKRIGHTLSPLEIVVMNTSPAGKWLHGELFSGEGARRFRRLLCGRDERQSRRAGALLPPFERHRHHHCQQGQRQRDVDQVRAPCAVGKRHRLAKALRQALGVRRRHPGADLRQQRFRVQAQQARVEPGGFTFAEGVVQVEAGLGGRVAATRQYMHQLETVGRVPTPEMIEALAAALDVTPGFFSRPAVRAIAPEHCHFRKQATTPQSVVQQVLAHGTLLDELERRDLRRGLATLCVGGGMGIAAIIERV